MAYPGDPYGYNRMRMFPPAIKWLLALNIGIFLLGLVGGAGLRAVSSTYWNTLPFPLIVLRRKLLPAGKGESDVKLSPRPVEAILNAAMKLERAWTATGAPPPQRAHQPPEHPDPAGDRPSRAGHRRGR